MKPFKDFFHYTRTERNGAVVLLLLCLALVVMPRLFTLFSLPKQLDFEEEERLAGQLKPTTAPENDGMDASAQLFAFDPNTATLEELQQLGLRERVAKAIVNYRSKGGQFRKSEDLKKIYTLSEKDYLRLEPYIRIAATKGYSDYSNDKKQPKTYSLFPFDPNTATEEELLRLGLPKGVVTVMLRFREKGGKYRRKEDLKKIYILGEEDYLRIEPYISIAGQQEGTIPVVSLDIPKAYDYQKNTVIDINKATAEEWQQLQGVGPAFSAKIVRFREALGGFTSIEQVAETRGLPDSTFQKIRLQLRHSPVFRLIDINSATAETLSRHPYMDRRTAEAIVSYRQKHGTFSSTEDLRKVYALPEGWIEKMRPYLEFGK